VTALTDCAATHPIRPILTQPRHIWPWPPYRDQDISNPTTTCPTPPERDRQTWT